MRRPPPRRRAQPSPVPRESGEGRREGRAVGQHGAARSPRLGAAAPPPLNTVGYPPSRLRLHARTSPRRRQAAPPPPRQGARSAQGPCSSAAARPRAGSSSSMNALCWAGLEATTTWRRPDMLDGAEEVGCAEAMAEGAECHDHLRLRPRGSASQRGQPRHDPDPPPPPPS
ncbi:uncharacterized protein LOC120713538 [Panicum virgatum]|uniref:uncharacterized protein LOC120713538 n=1 Tax=Panicum virgatum TaxID=38727 RepID=UPI0019D62584|nr:uncharacterized protein LOC120713538 [Panicum virgatum]